MEETAENDAANKESEKPDTEKGDSPSFHDFLEDDFLESLAVVDSWKADDEDAEPQENKGKVDSRRPRSSRDWGDRKDRRSSERNRTGQRRSRERIRDRGLNRYDRYSRYRYSPSSRSGRNDRSPKDISNRGSSRTRNITERYQRKSPDDMKSKRDKTEEHKPGEKIEQHKPRASSPSETLAKTEGGAGDKATQDNGTASSLVSPPKLSSSEQSIAIDTCIKEITDVVPPGTEEEFVNLAKNVGGKPQGFPEPEWNKRDLPTSEHKQLEKNGRKRSPTEYVKRSPTEYVKRSSTEYVKRSPTEYVKRSPTEYVKRSSEREYKHDDYLKGYGRSHSKEREPLRRNRSQSKEMHVPSTTRRSRSRERQTPTIKRRSRSRERQMPTIKRRSRSRERQMAIIKRRSRSRDRQTPIIKTRSRSRDRQTPIIKTRSRSRERQMPIIKTRSRSRERQMPTIKTRSRSRERQMPTIKRKSRSRERQMPAIKRRSRSRERQMPAIKRRSRSRERQTPAIKRRSQSREKILETQKKKLRRKREKSSPAIKKSRPSWSPEKKSKGTSGRPSPNRRPYASKTKDSYKGVDPELSPVSGISLSSPSLSLSPVSSEGERWRRRNSERRSPLSLSPARSYISLSSEHSDRSPKRKRSPFWRELQRTFAAQDMAKSHFAKIPPPQQQSYYQSKPTPPAQPVSYPVELYPNSAPNYPPPTANYYQPPAMQPPPPGDFMVPPPMVPSATAPMMVPPVSAPMMVPPVSTPMMVPPVTQMAPITYPPPPCPVPPPVQPVAPLQLEPPDPATWLQPITEHGGAPKWGPEHGGTPKWEPEKHVGTPSWEPEKPDGPLKWEPKNNDGAIKWEPEKYGAAPKWEPEKHDAPKWEPHKRGNAPKWKPEKCSGTPKREHKRDEELIPPPPPTISQPEKSLSSLLEASAKAGVTQKKPSVEHNVLNRCEEALRTLSADRGLVLSSSGSFVFHRDELMLNPLPQKSASRFQSPLLRNPAPVLNFTEPPPSKSSLRVEAMKAKEGGEGKKPSLLVKAAAKLASKEMMAHPAPLHDEAPSCPKCAERDKKKFVDCSCQASVASRTVALQCNNVKGKGLFEPEFGNNAPSVYRRYQPLPQPPKGILKSSRH